MQEDGTLRTRNHDEHCDEDEQGGQWKEAGARGRCYLSIIPKSLLILYDRVKWYTVFMLCVSQGDASYAHLFRRRSPPPGLTDGAGLCHRRTNTQAVVGHILSYSWDGVFFLSS